MNDNKNDSNGGPPCDDSATGEYPVLFDAIVETTDATAGLNGTAHDVTAEHPRPSMGEEAQVSGWLADLEAEIAGLHNRWRQVEEGFGAKDGLIAELKGEIVSRDGALADLRERLERDAEQLTALERALAGKNDEVASLSADLARGAAAHEQNVAAFAAAAVERQATQRELEVARAELTRLNAAVEREQAAVRALTERNEQLVAAQATLTLRIQELEAYIDGRAQSWSGLKTELSEQKNAILRLEKGLKSKDVAIDEGARARRELEQKLSDLERLNSEISGQRKEREAAYEDLQRRLEEHVAVAEHLKADLASRVADHDRLLASAAADRMSIQVLEGSVRDKDAALAALEMQLAANRSAAEERQLALERQLAERDTALVQSREHAEQQSHLAAQLKAELDIKRTSVDLLQRSAHRISNLGASLAELERRIESSKSARATSNTPVPAVEEPASLGAEPQELLPIESFLSLAGADGGGDDADDHAPKLVGSVGGESVSFPLSKGEVTIGRGKGSDIRISSHFISRHHAKISKRGIATTIEDIGSKNGIFVNANRIKRCVLRDGDVVSLASELELRFVDAAH